MIKIISPTHIMLPRKTKKDKRVSLNLNVYRNLHFQVNNQVKKIYNDLMCLDLSGIEFPNPIQIEFVLYKASKRKTDRSNILCIVEKFFCDSLTHYGCIPDDDDNHIISTSYRTAGVDKDAPRVEIFINDRRSGNEL